MSRGARRSPKSPGFCIVAALLLASLAGLVVGLQPAAAQQGLTSALGNRAKADPNANMVVKAREMIYDNDKNTVTAVGDVQIYYDGRVLQADRVVYDRASSRVHAVGNTKITEGGWHGHLCRYVRPHRRLQGRVHRIAADHHGRSHPIRLGARRTDGWQRHGVRARGVYGLRAMQGAS